MQIVAKSVSGVGVSQSVVISDSKFVAASGCVKKERGRDRKAKANIGEVKNFVDRTSVRESKVFQKRSSQTKTLINCDENSSTALVCREQLVFTRR